MTHVKMAEVSMQFSDKDTQIEHDCRVVFKQGYRFITGTEAAAKNMRQILTKAAHDHDYRIHFGGGDSWVAVQKSFIKGRKWKVGYEKVVEVGEGFGHHSQKGITWVKFPSVLGRDFLIGSAHYLVRGAHPGDVNYHINLRFKHKMTLWAKQNANPGDVCVYGGDQNIVDKTSDTFFGAPFTSAWDSLHKWQNTGHGNIDVLAAWDRSRSIEWLKIHAYRDKEIFLFTDHFLVEAVLNVTAVKHKGKPTTRVAKNLRQRGCKVYGHKRCLIFSSVYKSRRRTRPHSIIWNSDGNRKNDRVDTLWAHISVTKAVGNSIGFCMRTLHQIGMERFGSGVSYNFAVHHRTGQIGLGQPLDAKGTHTIMRVPRPGFSTDQNAVSLAIVFIGMPGMIVEQAAWESYEHIIAALIEEGFLTTTFDHEPHSFADPGKDCPTQVVRDRLDRLKRGGLAKVR